MLTQTERIVTIDDSAVSFPGRGPAIATLGYRDLQVETREAFIAQREPEISRGAGATAFRGVLVGLPLSIGLWAGLGWLIALAVR